MIWLFTTRTVLIRTWYNDFVKTSRGLLYFTAFMVNAVAHWSTPSMKSTRSTIYMSYKYCSLFIMRMLFKFQRVNDYAGWRAYFLDSRSFKFLSQNAFELTVLKTTILIPISIWELRFPFLEYLIVYFFIMVRLPPVFHFSLIAVR